VAVWLQRHLPEYRIAGLESWQLDRRPAVSHRGLVPLRGCKLRRHARRAAHTEPFPEGIEAFFRTPLRLFLFLVIFRVLMDQLALSLTARVYLNSSGVDYHRLLDPDPGDHLPGTGLQHPPPRSCRQPPVRGSAQALHHHRQVRGPDRHCPRLGERAGYNMSTIIAGLGVGSLAVALAAQKTLENVIGAITLYSARPVNPGDLCRFGDIVGTVEEIGLRSTIIRTLDRTLLAVPNSVFSSVEVENFSHRDRIRFYRHLELQMPTADQLRVILGRLRELFLSHEDVVQETASIRLEKIIAANAIIRIDAGIATTDYQRFLAVAEDLNLRMIELVHAAGAVFSGPGQVLQIREFHRASEDTLADVETQLERWRSEDSPRFPDLKEEDKVRLAASIGLPGREKS
jgi:MscS family membrane protein